MSGHGDPFREYYYWIERRNRIDRIHRVIGCALVVLSALVTCLFVWALIVWALTA